MDKRKNYYLGLDTETANGFTDENGKSDLSQSLVYDIGWAITDKKGNIYETRSYVVADIYCDHRDLMNTCYYAEKLPRYEEDLRNGTRKLATLATIRKQLCADLKDYNITAVFAHNASFDYRALNNTIRYITKSARRYFFPYGTEIWDTLKMSKVITAQKTYTAFCEANGYKTKHRPPRNRATAEILYRYITGNNDFQESHTALEDVIIETAIFAHCLKQHKKIEKKLFP